MSSPSAAAATPIDDVRDLVAYLAEGCRPPEQWRIGTEHEKFAFRQSDLRPLPYDGPDGIGALLAGLQRFGWQPVREAGNIIALSQGQASITLEPGGQFELSGAPLSTLHETRAEIMQHLAQVKAVGDELGIAFMGMGFQPKWRRADIPMMPKGRYRIMADYMPKRGDLGLDMMKRTCTVQVNLDFSSEARMVQMFRVSLALQPVATALFAISPFTEGHPNGFQSYRAQIWTDTDPDRCGGLPFVFEPGFGFARYVEYALNVPMYFVYRDGRYIDATGQSFRDFLKGRLPALPGELPLMTDWADHLTTLFPDVRLKRYLEMRGADCGPLSHLCALPALWTGLLYDDDALNAAWDLVKDWTPEQRAALRLAIPRQGLTATIGQETVQDTARRMVEIAAAGLTRRGLGEAVYLEPLAAIAANGRSEATVMLERFDGEWRGDVDRVFEDYAY